MLNKQNYPFNNALTLYTDSSLRVGMTKIHYSLLTAHYSQFTNYKKICN